MRQKQASSLGMQMCHLQPNTPIHNRLTYMGHRLKTLCWSKQLIPAELCAGAQVGASKIPVSRGGLLPNILGPVQF